jgi:O-antigen ligase/tetratricopeptide (TPR) repeat protein
MTLEAIVRWTRRRTEAEWVGLAAGMTVFGYVGWDSALWDARFQLLLHLVAVGAIAGLGVVWLRGRELPRTRIDLPLLALLAAFALATVSALNLGMSLRAMAAITAFALMLPVALLAVRHRPSWVGVVTSVPVLALAIPALAVLGVRRIEWILAGAPGLPPIRLPAEGTPFGSVAVPPFVIWPAWALAGLIEAPRWRRGIQIALIVVGVPLTVLSGSRSAWLAIGVTVLAAGVPWAWARRHRLRVSGRPDARTTLIALAGLVGVVATVVLVAPRVTAVTSLLYRANLWRDTLTAWNTDPLLGIGPGFMPYARLAAAPDYSFPVRQPHSHNLPLGVLGDAGLVGLVAALMLVGIIAWVAGPWRSRTSTGRTASLVLLGLAVGGLFEDLTFLPNFNLLAIALLAVALADAGAVRWVRPSRQSTARRAGLAGAMGATCAVLLAAMVTADAGAVAYRAGIDASADGRWTQATAWLERSVAIDPWHPGGAKALAVAADGAGRTELARDAAETAVERNPGDAASWTNIALLCGQLADRDCQARASERAVATAPFLRSELVNAAFSYESLGLAEEADDAYRRSLLSQRLTSLATDWPRTIEIGNATLDEDFGALFEFNRLLGWWAMDEPVDPETIADPGTRALAHAMRGERHEGEEWLARAIDEQPGDVVVWELAVVLRDHWGLAVEREMAIASIVRGSGFPSLEPNPATRALTFDIGSFRAYPRDGLVGAAERLRTDPAYPWALTETLP